MNALNRPFHRWLIALLIFCVGISVSGRTSAEAQTAADQLRSAWRVAQSAESYRAISDIEMTFTPADPTAETERLDWYVTGEVMLPDSAARLTMQIEGDAFSSRQMTILQRGNESFLEQPDGRFEPTHNPLGLALPTVDAFAYLKAATDVHLLESTPDWERVGFTLDGAALAAEVQKGQAADLPPALLTISGDGELWIGADGLPLRQLLQLNLPDAGEAHAAQVRFLTDFSGYGTIAPIPMPIESADGTYRLPINSAESLPANLPNFHIPKLNAPYTFLIVLLTLTTLLLLRQRQHTQWFQRVLAILLVTNMLFNPLFQLWIANGQLRRAEAAAERFDTAATTTLNSALGIDEIEQQAAADEAIRAQRSAAGGVATGAIDQCADPHAREGNHSDDDTLDDFLESCIGTDPFSADTDNDGINDDVELKGFMLGGQRWTSDPFEIDSNRDGRSDQLEWSTAFGGLAANNDIDGDNIPNIWDEDDDNDNVPDRADLSPETWRQNPGEFPLTVARGGSNSIVYIDVQVRPTNADHLRYSLGVLDWPYDEQGEMRDLDNSTDDLRLVPMLEIETDSKPDAALAAEYGAVPAGNLYLPLYADSSGGAISSYRTRVAYNLGVLGSDIEWRKVRLVWVAQAIVDDFINCKDPNKPDANSCQIRTNGRILTSYTDPFHLTGLAVTRHDGMETLVVGTPNSPNVDNELFAIAFGLNNSFLTYNNLADIAGGSTALAEIDGRLTQNGLDRNARFGLSGAVPTLYHSYSHEDAALADTNERVIRDYLNQNYPDAIYNDVAMRGRAADGSTFKVASLLTAWEKTEAVLNLSGMGSGALSVNAAGIDSVTQRGVKMQTYQSAGMGADWVSVSSARLVELLYQRYSDADLSAIVAGQPAAERSTVADLRTALLAGYMTWQGGVTRYAAYNGTQAIHMRIDLQADTTDEEDVASTITTDVLDTVGLFITDLPDVLESFAVDDGAGNKSYSPEFAGIRAATMFAGQVAFGTASVVCTADESACNAEALEIATKVFDYVSLVDSYVSVVEAAQELAAASKALKFSSASVVGAVIGAVIAIGVTWIAFGLSLGSISNSVDLTLAVLGALAATIYAISIAVLSAFVPLGTLVAAVFAFIDVFLSILGAPSVVEIWLGYFYNVKTRTKVDDVSFGSPALTSLTPNLRGTLLGSRFRLSGQFSGSVVDDGGADAGDFRDSWIRGWYAGSKPGANEVPNDITPTDAFNIEFSNRPSYSCGDVARNSRYRMSKQCQNTYSLTYAMKEVGVNRVLKLEPHIQSATTYSECSLWGLICWKDGTRVDEMSAGSADFRYFDVFPTDVSQVWSISTVSNADADFDGVYNWEEFIPPSDFSEMNDWDVDDDTLSDGYEKSVGSDLRSADSDSDGLRDADELRFATTLLDADSDDDGLLDGMELFHHDGTMWAGGWTLDDLTLPTGEAIWLFSNPASADADGDNLTDAQEREKGTSPFAFNAGQPSVRITFPAPAVSPDGIQNTLFEPSDNISFDIAVDNTTLQELGGSLKFCPPSGVSNLVGADLTGSGRTFSVATVDGCLLWEMNPSLARGGTVSATLMAQIDANASGTIELAAELKASANFRVLLPLYTYPTVGTVWDDVATANSATPITAIINPSNGPIADGGTPIEQSIYDDYQAGIADLAAANVEMIGYVASSYGSFDLNDLKTQIDIYVADYPHITGIFVDEAANNPPANELQNYKALRDYIKGQGLDLVVLNTGLNASESYFIEDATDVIVMFEQVAAQWTGYTPVPYYDDYSKNRFAALVHTQPTEAGMLSDIEKAKELNIGYIYVTDDSTETTNGQDGNPWNSLATYWQAMIDRMAALNNDSVPINYSQPIVIDNDAPVIAPALQDDDRVTGDVLTLTGNASDATSWIERVQVRVAGGSWETATGTSAWSFSTPLPQSDGTLNIDIRAFDALDHVTQTSLTLGVDQSAPTVTLDQQNIEIAHSRVIALSGSADDTLYPPERVQVSINGGRWQEATLSCSDCNATPRSWAFDWQPGDVARGAFEIEVRAIDGVGQTSPFVATSVIVDQDAPTSDLIDRRFVQPMSADGPDRAALQLPFVNSQTVLHGYANDAGRAPLPPRPAPLTGAIDAVADATVYISPSDAAAVTGAFIYNAAWVGDMNGDGRADLAVSLPGAYLLSGEVAIIFGQAGDFTLPPDVEVMSDADGRFFGQFLGAAGLKIASLGDINGDGLSDLGVISSAELFVIFGQSANYGESTLIPAGSSREGQAYQAATVELPSGVDVDDFAAAGDFNGDGYDDILIESADSFRIVSVRAFAPDATGYLPTETLVRLPNMGDSAGNGIGDVNGDAIDDVAIGKEGETVHIYTGDSDYTPVTYIYTDTVSGDARPTISTSDAARVINTPFGGDLTALGNVNGDGFSDFAFFSDSVPQVVLGSADLAAPLIPLTYDAPADRFISAPGDVNADGIDDLLLGYDGGGYLLHGHANIDTTGTRVAATIANIRGAADAPYAAGSDLNCDLSSDLLLIPSDVPLTQNRSVGEGINVSLLRNNVSAAPMRVTPATTPNRAVTAQSVTVDDGLQCNGAVPCVRTLQEAVDAVSADGEINILPGVYAPFSVTNKDHLTIRGINADGVFIDGGGSGDGITLSALNGITITEVTIRNVTRGVVISDVGQGSNGVDGNNGLLTNIVIHDFTTALEMDRDSMLTVRDATIAGDHDSGDYIELTGAAPPSTHEYWTQVADSPVPAGADSHFFGTSAGALLYPLSDAQSLYHFDGTTWHYRSGDGNPPGTSMVPVPALGSIYHIREQSPKYRGNANGTGWLSDVSGYREAFSDLATSWHNGRTRTVSDGGGGAYAFTPSAGSNFGHSTRIFSHDNEPVATCFCSTPLPAGETMQTAYDIAAIGQTVYLLNGTKLWSYHPSSGWTARGDVPFAFGKLGLSLTYVHGDRPYLLAVQPGAADAGKNDIALYDVNGGLWQSLPDTLPTLIGQESRSATYGHGYILNGRASNQEMYRFNLPTSPTRLRLHNVAMVGAQNNDSTSWLNDEFLVGGALPADFPIDIAGTQWVSPNWTPVVSGLIINPFNVGDPAFVDVENNVYSVVADSPLTAGYRRHTQRDVHVYVDQAACNADRCSAAGAELRAWGVGAFDNLYDALATGAPEIIVHPGQYTISDRPLQLYAGQRLIGVDKDGVILQRSADNKTLLLVEGSPGVGLENLTLRGHGGEPLVTLYDGATLWAQRLLLTQGLFAIGLVGATTHAELANLTLIDNGVGVSANGCAGFDVRNSLFMRHTTVALYREACANQALHTYNAFYGNAVDFSIDGVAIHEPGSGDLFVEPQIDLMTYRPNATSPLIDAGDPLDPVLPGTGNAVDIGFHEGGQGTLTVDDDYCATCENDGLQWGVNAFDNIQAGVDAAAAYVVSLGSTAGQSVGQVSVGIAPGDYSGTVRISSSHIALIGSGYDSRHVGDGGRSNIEIYGNGLSGITISGLHLAGDSASPHGIEIGQPGVGQWLGNIVIERNLILGQQQSGIILDNTSSQPLIRFNTIANQEQYNLIVRGSIAYPTITDNIFLGTATTQANFYLEHVALETANSIVFGAQQIQVVTNGFAYGYEEIDPTLDVQFRPQIGSPAIDAASVSADPVAGGGTRADIGYAEYWIPPFLLLFGKQGDNTCAVGNAGVGGVEFGISEIIYNEEKTLTDYAPTTWTAATVDRVDERGAYWSADLPAASDGVYAFFSRATDQLGTQEDVPQDWWDGAFILDNEAPTVTLTQPSGAVPINGAATALTAIATDNMVIYGTLHDTIADLYFEVDGQRVDLTRRRGGAGGHQFGADIAVTGSAQTIQAVAVDLAGNVTKSDPVTLNGTRRTTAAEAASLALANTTVNTTTLTANGFARFDTASGNDGRVTVRVNGGVATAVMLDSAAMLTAWSAGVTLPNVEGDHTVEVLLDNAVVDSATITLDTTPPAVTIDTPAADSTVGTTVALAGTNELDATVEFSVDGGATWSIATVDDTVWSATWFAPLNASNMPAELRVRVTDLAGNSATLARNVRVNGVLPVAFADVGLSHPVGTHFDVSGSVVVTWTAVNDPLDTVDVRVLASQNQTETLTADHNSNDTEATLLFDQAGAWYVHLAAVDAFVGATTARYGPYYVGAFGCGGAAQSIVLDGFIDVGNDEWRRATEWLDDDHRSTLRPELYATWVDDTFYAAYRNGLWDVDGELWLYLGSDAEGTTQSVVGGRVLPFSADQAIHVNGANDATLYQWNGGAWQAANPAGFHAAYAYGDSEVAVPLNVGGTVRLFAYAANDDGSIDAVFPTTNPLDGVWEAGYEWATPCSASVVSDGQPAALDLDLSISSLQSASGQWGAGQTLDYVVTVVNGEVSRSAENVTLTLNGSNGLTLPAAPINVPTLAAGASFSATVQGALANDLTGIDSVTATVTDGDVAADFSHTTDYTPPTVTLIESQLWAQTGSFTFNGLADDAGGSGTANVVVSGGSVTGTRAWAATVNVGGAPLDVQVTATDARGNSSAPLPVTINVDNDAPTVALQIASGLTETIKAVVGSSADATSGIAFVEVQMVENGQWRRVDQFDSADGSWLFLWNPTGVESPRIRARATDKAGNQTITEWQSAVLLPPGGMTDLSLWLSASAGVRASSGAVSQWDDLSGLNRHAVQPTALMQPTLVGNALNGLPVMRFDGTNDFLEVADAAIDGATEFTFIVVFDRQGNTGPWQRLWEFGDGGNQRFGYVTPENGTGVQQFTLYDLAGGATTEVHASALNATGAQLLTLHWPTAGSGTIFTNGNATGTGPVYLSPTTLGDINFHVLGKAVGGFDNFAGDIAEVILFPTALSELERTQVELYLADKYALDWAGTTLYGDATYAQQVRGISQQAGIGNSADSGGLSISDQTFLQDDNDLILFGHDGGDDITNADVPAPATWRVVREWRVVPNDDGANGGQIKLTFDLAALGISSTIFPADDYFLLTRSSNGRAPFGVVSADQVTVDGTNVNFTVDTSALDNLVTLATREEPTAITLDSFTTQQTDDGTVLVEWVTEAEFDLAGFNLYRTATTQFVDNGAINGLLLPSTGLQGQGDSYSFEETGVASRTWYYWLEDMDIHGERTLHGPVEQVVTEPTVVSLRGVVTLHHSLWMIAFLMIGVLTVAVLIRTRRRE